MKRLSLFLTVLALAIGAVACGDGSSGGPAATVNGTEISQKTLVDELEAIAANASYASQVESSSGTKVHGSSGDSFDPTFVALVLGRQIAFQLVGDEVVKRKLPITADVRDAARTDLYNQMGNQDPAKGKTVFEAFPKAYQDQLLGWNADVLTLQAALADQPPATDASEQKYYDDHVADFVQVCAAHILVDTADKASALKAQLDAGADFATLAAANSSDTGSAPKGGDLGCAGKGSYVKEFEDAALAAPIGQVVGPVQTQFGFHLIKVSSRDTPPFDQVKDQVVKAMSDAVSSAFSDYFKQAISAAKVTVNAKYGTWDEATGQVTPPASSASTTTTVPGASGSLVTTSSTDPAASTTSTP